MWMYDSNIVEYDITLTPWSSSYNRTITLPPNINLGNGISGVPNFLNINADNNTQLITTNTNTTPHEIIVLDITFNTAISTTVATLPPNRVVSGDLVLTTTGKILLTNYDNTNNNLYLTQYDYNTGLFEVEVDINVVNYPFGILFTNLKFISPMVMVKYIKSIKLTRII